MYIIPKIIRKIIGKPALKNINLGKGSKIDIFCDVVNSNIGKYSYIGRNSSVLHTDIGSFVSISNYCAIGGGSHPVEWVSTSPIFTNQKSILNKNFSDNEFNPYVKTVIGNDVWIGSHCLIKGGVTIGDGAVIGMGSVVTKDIGQYEIWAGNPARFIRKRFKDEEIQYLLQMKWWDLNDKDLHKVADSFNSLEKVKVLEKE